MILGNMSSLQMSTQIINTKIYIESDYQTEFFRFQGGALAQVFLNISRLLFVCKKPENLSKIFDNLIDRNEVLSFFFMQRYQ